ncbi:MAG: FAD-dependent oxidoreductase [bacterium]
MKNVLILGGGIGGLSAAWMLTKKKFDVTVIEKARETGGICGTFNYKDFRLDYGPHKFYSVLPGIMKQISSLMGDEFIRHKKRNRIYLFKTFLNYPVKITELLLNMGFNNIINCLATSLIAMLSKTGDAHTNDSYENYLKRKFGSRLYEIVFEPLADKVWGDPSTLSAEMAKTRIPSKSVIELALRILGLKKESRDTNAEFFYYPRKGFGRIAARMQEEILKAGGKILTGSVPVELVNDGKTVREVKIQKGGSNQTIKSDILISSIPLKDLVQLLGDDQGPQPKNAFGHVKKLEYRTTFLVYLVFNQKQITDQHWIFFPERQVIFSRVFEQKLMSPEMIPEDKTVLCCDFTDYPDGPISKKTDRELIQLCIKDLEKIGLIKKENVEHGFIKRFPDFYPRYNLNYQKNISGIYDSLREYKNLILTGRLGFYNYNNADHCIDMAGFIAENLANGRNPSDICKALEQRVAGYKIVD